jgi:hypothetical protein
MYRFPITRNNRLKQLKEKITVYLEDHTNLVNELREKKCMDF